ncbi:lecithin retinol acyltransferase [Ictalurus punctatus]|uniref:Lecithin retinol acyltransferase n=1 Tax=Ictalurus punctatus TaxID=7998 RepID=A0A2D0Q742_ICTPU|nr:lecithin retinol acyltransferase [Ictalurus punctatus]XP_017313536.1 lecithin retinol acyltransferase [Ictalurus punctatus]XP_053471654.1 lecithin retinol acyltransferase-like [Ictalurus furcatus]XP_053471655.1 lecithin retinol acyltransferase-like [Ictalurus furcatus]
MMLDSLLLLLQKMFLFAHRDFFSVVASRADKPRRAERTERAGAEVTAQLERGDLLEVPRTLFVHFGIYLGDGKVAHLIPDILPLLTRDELRVRAVVSNKRLLLGVLCRRAAVRVDTLEDFVYGARVLLINAMDGVLGVQPAPNEEVARTAEKLIGAVRYSLLWNNCEHFVTFCRYGTGISLQTDKFCECLKSVLRDQRSVLVTSVTGIFLILFLGLSACTALPVLLVSFILWMVG